MNLEDSIKDVIQQKLSDGTIEKIITEKLEKGINEAMVDLFRSYGDIGTVIKDKVKEVMIPAIEKHDFSDHLVKLDLVLTEIVNTTGLQQNKEVLKNFKELMIEPEQKEMKTSELFEKWCDFVAKNVEINGLDVEYDDTPYYEAVEGTMTIEYEEGRGWSDSKKANIIFECEHDEDMNIIIPISMWDKYDHGKWSIGYGIEPTFNSLRGMNDFEILLYRFKRAVTKLIIDDEDVSEEIQPEAEPEASFS